MTRDFLRGVHEVHGSPLFMVAVTAIAAVLVPLFLIGDFVGTVATLVVDRLLERPSFVRCDAARGHSVSTYGLFVCPGCGKTEERSAYVPCSCGDELEALVCACGATTSLYPSERR